MTISKLLTWLSTTGFLLLNSVVAQTITSITYSPYSALGIGEIAPNGSVRNLSMAGVSIASTNFFTVNSRNPATYADLQLTTLDVGGIGEWSNSQTEKKSNSGWTGGFSHFALGFAFGKNVGMAVGLRPYSTVGYEVSTDQPLQVDTSTFLTTIYRRADGGINDSYIGIAARFFKHLNLGANLHYRFGSITQSTETYVTAGYQNIQYNKTANFANLTASVGFLYGDTLKLGWNRDDSSAILNRTYSVLRVGGCIDLGSNLSGQQLNIFNNALNKDTLGTSKSGSITLPPAFGLGISLDRFKPGTKMSIQSSYLTIGIDAWYQDWKNFRYFG
ncbi:MAG: hypothetical protein NZ108_00625, partial [Bacteroidia bacterium]|nr:hypothetical protein [Bacteroidia bacterium]